MTKMVFTSAEFGYLFFLVIVIATLYILLYRYRENMTERYVGSQNLQSMRLRRSRRFFWLYVVSLVLTAILAVTALMQPLEMEPKLVREEIDEVALVLDVSASMGVTDAHGGASRFLRAKEIMEAIVEHLNGSNVSLYIFAGNTENIVPATMDSLYLSMVLDSVAINDTRIAGTNFLALLQFMKDKYLDSTTKKRVQVVLLTDGEDTTIIDLTAQEKKSKENALCNSVQPFSKEGIHWNVIGMGTAQGSIVPQLSVVSALHQNFLEEFAAAGKGKCYFDSKRSLSDITDELVMEIAYRPHEEEKMIPQHELFYYPLFLAVLFLMTALLLPERVLDV